MLYNEHMESQDKNSVGGIIGAIIIVILLLAGAWYFFSNRIEKIKIQKQNASSTEIIDGEILSVSATTTVN